MIELNVLMSKTIDEYIILEKGGDSVLLERKRAEIFMIKTVTKSKENNSILPMPRRNK